ncbi:hypothetical protein [Nocardioides sp. SYSU DS0663]|uniref:hypothetical protein n=1 Tax=Nocardioides sp. SYSU DS0663 TaxID=3416445 RepID=UPI003F4B44AE
MQRDDEDDAWRSIVENYGERPQIDDEPPPARERPTPPADDPAPDPADVTGAAGPGHPGHPEDPDEVDSDLGKADGERFIPPQAPPLPRPRGLRAVAWAGVLGAPAVLLVFTVLGVDLPDLVVQALVAWFVGGFVYLVWTMPRGPRDPWDDGAKL